MGKYKEVISWEHHVAIVVRIIMIFIVIIATGRYMKVVIAIISAPIAGANMKNRR